MHSLVHVVEHFDHPIHLCPLFSLFHPPRQYLAPNDNLFIPIILKPTHMSIDLWASGSSCPKRSDAVSPLSARVEGRKRRDDKSTRGRSSILAPLHRGDGCRALLNRFVRCFRRRELPGLKVGRGSIWGEKETI